MKRRRLNLWKSKHPGLIVLRMVVLLVIGLYGYLMLFEESFIFFPEPYPAGNWEVNGGPTPEGRIVTRVEDVWLTTDDGVRLHAWLGRPFRMVDGELLPVEVPGVVLWTHGNAGNISHRYQKLDRLVTTPVAVLILDYRGYGRSEGRPDEDGLYQDVRAAWRFLVGEGGYSPDKVVLYGVSLGGAVAIDLAMEVTPAGLIVESSFTSIPDMAAETMPFVPRAIVRTNMDSRSKIARVDAAKLFIHSDADQIIPFHMGQTLFETASEPKQFYEVQGAGHNETDLVGGEAYFEAIQAFIEKVLIGE